MTTPYYRPQAVVQQDFKVTPASLTQPLTVALVGPRYRFFDLDDSTDKSLQSYGQYTGIQSVKPWQALPSNSVVDEDNVRVVMENILAEYADFPSSGTIQRGASLNKIKIISGAFVTNGAGTRNVAFKNRDVRVGDRVRVVDVATGTKIKETRITALTADIVAAVIPSPAVNAGTNPATQAESFTYQAGQSDDQGTGHLIDPGAGINYVGNLATGVIADTYTIEVTTGGGVGVAKLKVTSASGEDDQENITFSAFATDISAGTRGFEFQIDQNGGPATLTAGEVYVVDVEADYTQQTPVTTGSTFSGSTDTIYKVEVVKGGLWADNPKVKVTTNNGIDGAAAQIVSATQSFPLGNLGVVMNFNDSGPTPQNGLRLGDIYTISVTAATTGPIRTATLADPLDATIIANENLLATFFLYQASKEIPAKGFPEFGDENWATSDTDITFEAGIETLDSSWVDNDLVTQLPLTVYKADLYVEYRALLRDGSNTIGTLSELGLVETVLGSSVPENPLAFAATYALQNSGGKGLLYLPVESDDLSGYQAALSVLEASDDAFYIVPLTQDSTIIDLLEGHVNAESEPTKAHERRLVVSRTLDIVDILVDKDGNNNNLMGTVATDGNNFVLVNLPGGEFLTNGVRSGDFLRTKYAFDEFGKTVYESYKIATVTDEDNLVLVAPGLPAAIVSAERMTVARVLTKDEQAAKVAALSTSFSNRRVNNIWPDVAKNAGRELPGYFLAAAVAGLKSGVAPHQGVTLVTVNGFDDLSKSFQYFTPTQLDTIAAGGTLIVTQDRQGGQAFVRHQLTTDRTDENRQEWSVNDALDSITKSLRNVVKPLVGRYNINDNLLTLLDTVINQHLDSLIRETLTTQAGAILNGFTVIKIEQDPLIRTQVNIEIELNIPAPLNVVRIKLVVV